MTQWKDKTRGGDPVKNVRPNNDGTWKWVGDIIKPDGSRSTVVWTEKGHYYVDQRDRNDLIPIEPEAPSPAKVRVDLALAAHSLRAAALEFQQAEDALQRAKDAKDKAGEAMYGAFAAAGMLDVVVKIDGDYYHFFASELTTRFRKIEVL
jgi:hypothetical protein